MRSVFAVSVATCLFASAAAGAPWDRSENKDQMRGIVSNDAAITVGAIGDGSVSLGMHVIENSPKVQGVVFRLHGDKVACKESLCEFDVRFGEGAIKRQTVSVDGSGETFVPTSNAAFTGSVGLIKELYIEVPTLLGGKKQFKFDIDSPAFPRVMEPEFIFAGVRLGGSALNLSDDFVTTESAASLDCREATGVKGEIPNIMLKSAKMCFYNGMLFSVFIESANKAESGAISNMITSKFGPKDSESVFDRWPASTGKVVELNTASASFWPDSKVKGAGRFMISDESIANLIPK